jgi:hypothetical protein
MGLIVAEPFVRRNCVGDESDGNSLDDVPRNLPLPAIV